jgi:hypothetical protein
MWQATIEGESLIRSAEQVRHAIVFGGFRFGGARSHAGLWWLRLMSDWRGISAKLAQVW